MFGYVVASLKELAPEARDRYQACYCGICRAIGAQSSGLSRVALNYDMTFLALLLGSLYEPEETLDGKKCMLHPFSHRQGLRGEFISYAADMNVALAYFSADDHWKDDRSYKALALKTMLKKRYPGIAARYPRQCRAMEECIRALSGLEKARCPNPDLPANCFGRLMAELFTYTQDLWTPYLRQMAMALGRFIYFVDAAVDSGEDRRTGNYNPFLAMEPPAGPDRWEEYLVLEMARCTRAYEMLPLVQDKALLDNILYSGVWLTYRKKRKKTESNVQEDQDV